MPSDFVAATDAAAPKPHDVMIGPDTVAGATGQRERTDEVTVACFGSPLDGTEGEGGHGYC